MKVLFYWPQDERNGRGMEEVIASIPEESREVLESLDALSSSLRRAGRDRTIVVITALSKKDILDMILIRDLLLDMRLVSDSAGQR
jgi:hypothetical protein